MSEQWQIALLGVFVTLGMGLMGIICVVLWYKLLQVDELRKQYDGDRINTENRISIVEERSRNSMTSNDRRFDELRTALDHLADVTEKRFVVVGAKALHSPDNHLDVDPELERFATLYVQHGHDMPFDKGSDWAYWRAFFYRLSMNERATPNERLLAKTFKELCEHKLLKAGLLKEIIERQASNT